ncbi:hypothetical protein [Hungatella hathewayi]|uniref:hypothetical protein n=1 Tax=Hungatella hathewayi TaxID=154046 RepID=UPI0035667193
MEVIEKGNAPDGTRIQIEDWSMNYSSYPRKSTIGFYPKAKHSLDGKYYIVIKRNECYHGTPHYDEYSRKELTKEEYAAANGLREMMKIIQKTH